MADTGCCHPMCSDVATHWVKKDRPLCMAHKLEWLYFEHKKRKRAEYKPRVRNVKPCGTPAAAARHRRHGEPVCDACRIADNARTNAWKVAARERRQAATTSERTS